MHRQTILGNLFADKLSIGTVGNKANAAETCEAIFTITNFLKNQNIVAQDRIAIVMSNSREVALIYIACLCSRIIICPIDVKAKPVDLEYCLSIVKPKHIFTDGANIGNVAGGVTVTTLNSNFWENNSRHFNDDINYQQEDIFSITFTSGTSGRPKAIMHKAESLLDCAFDFNTITATDEKHTFLHVMPMYYMAGLLNTILCPILACSTLIIDKSFGVMSPFSFWQNWIDNQITHTWLSPTMISAIVSLDRADDLREEIKSNAHKYRIFSGTAPLAKSLKQTFKETYDINLIESYGLSEILYVSVKNPVNNTHNSSVGNLLPGTKITILETGELAFYSKYSMAGYLQEDGSLLTVKDNFFRSGDIGELNDGELYITGRIKDLIIKGGKNISARDIEETLEQLPVIKQVAIKGVSDAFYGETIICFYVGDIDYNELKRYCIDHLDADKIPEHFVKMLYLPVGPTGKVKKNELTFDAINNSEIS